MRNTKRYLVIFSVFMLIFIQAALILRPFVKAENKEEVECLVKVQGLDGDVITGKASGKNALEIVKKVLDENSFKYTLNDQGNFTQIYDLAQTQSEKWQYSIKNGNNEIKPEIALQAYIPKGNDEITVYYSEITGDKPSDKAETVTTGEKQPSQCLVRVEGLNDTIVSGKAQGYTAIDIVKKVLGENNIQYTLDGDGNITGINSLNQNQASLWKFYIKKSDSVVIPKTGLADFVPDNQDEIILYYTHSKVKYLTSALISENPSGGYKLSFLNEGSPIANSLVTIDNINYVTDENGEISISELSQGTHTYKISGYNCGKLSTVVMDQGTIFADGKNLPRVSFTSPNNGAGLNFYNEAITTADAVKNYGDPFAYVSLNKLHMSKNEEYINIAYKRIKNSSVENLSNGDLESLIIALTACGYTSDNFAGSNMVSALYSRNIDSFRTDDMINALLIMNYANIPNNYKINRRILVQKLLDNEYTEENNTGWGIGNSADPYITGTALCALAPFDNMENVKTAIESAVKTLAKIQKEDGYISGYNGITSETVASVITGLIAVGVNPEGITTFDDGTKVNFAKPNGSLITAMMSFKGDSGLFKHMLGEGNNLSASEQCLRALLAVYKYKTSGYAYDYFNSEIDASKLKIYPAPADNENNPNQGNTSDVSNNGNVQPSPSKGDNSKTGNSDTGEGSKVKKVESKSNINISVGGLILIIGAIGVAAQALNLNRRE